MGYTPLFDSLTKGTLCGRWPDIGLWPIVLSLADRHGVVDVTCAYIAGVTGLAAEEVAACMTRFCEPDPGSRCDLADGARLTLLDKHRDWGWQIVNHGRYREKARLMQRESDRVSSGENARRMGSRRPPKTPEDPLRPPSIHSSDGDGDGDVREEKKTPTPFPEGLDPAAWALWSDYKHYKPRFIPIAQRKLAELGSRQLEAVEHSIANGYTGCYLPKPNGKSRSKWE